jgi:ribosomal protein S27E
MSNGLTNVQQRLLDGVNSIFYCPRCGVNAEEIYGRGDNVMRCNQCGLAMNLESFWHDNPFGTLNVKGENKI